MGVFLPKLDKTMGIAMGEITVMGIKIKFEVIPTPRFMRFWQTNSLRIQGAAVNFPEETAEASYDQAQMQRLLDFAAALSRGLAG